MDQQHLEIVRLINTLATTSEISVRSELISETLTNLTNYANEHFREEERLLEEHGYPELAAQKADHRAYRMKVVAFCQETMDGEENVPAGLLDFLRDWWVDHILHSDMEYRGFLEARGVT